MRENKLFVHPREPKKNPLRSPRITDDISKFVSPFEEQSLSKTQLYLNFLTSIGGVAVFTDYVEHENCMYYKLLNITF